MNYWVKRIHTWFGLLNFTIVLVFGATGLLATFRPAPAERRPPQTTTSDVPFTPSAGVIADKDVAVEIRRKLDIPAAGGNVRRDGDNNLVASFSTPNGLRRVTYLEKENRLRVESRHNNIWQFFNVLHETLPRQAEDGRIRLWGYYTEFSLWSLIGMTLTGFWLWLATRPGFRWAQISFAAGTAVFTLLWIFSR
ncbi:MAG: PepSY domain-containing protein [Candidatus Solibacter usitatus]|nr:PepSY domain-containing protein [Candidatus Solibacter usitatus]